MLEYERPACRVLSGLVQARQSSWSIIAIQCYRGMRVDGAEEGRGRSSRASCQVKPDYDINVAKVVGCFRSVHSWQTMVDKAKGVACYRVKARRGLGKANRTCRDRLQLKRSRSRRRICEARSVGPLSWHLGWCCAVVEVLLPLWNSAPLPGQVRSGSFHKQHSRT